ncbi:MAG TPA: N-formylglutamate amidohydrolase [Caulobacteraceae bacterium]
MRNPHGASPLLLLGDHAGLAIPAALGRLGLADADLGRHIACDIGVAGLGAALSRSLDAVFISQRYSRLVIDCNRALADPGSIAAESDGCVIPGNAGLTHAQRTARAEAVFHPYHHAIAAELDARRVRGQRSILVALHSFTPALNDRAHRPWRYGVLHRHDSAFSAAVLAVLTARFGPDVVGDNQPYAMDGTDFTVPVHMKAKEGEAKGGDPRGADYLELEVRQDTIDTPAGQGAVAVDLVLVFAEALDKALAAAGSA